MKYTCPECQKTFKETPSLEDFIAKCPHCGVEVTITADPTMVALAKIEAGKKEEAARKEADQKSKDAAEQSALRKQEERNVKAVALVSVR